MSYTFPAESSNIAPGFQAKVEENGVENEEIVRLRAKHELWKVYAPEWELYLAAYEGGPDFANGKNLFKHQRENPDDFADRAQRVHYFNYCEPLVDFFTNFIFTETIQRDGGNNQAFYQQFCGDVNKKGDNITDYMKLVSDDMQIFGMSFTLIDTPSLPIEEGSDGTQAIVTKQMEEDLGIRPYWVLIKPEEIIDWSLDEFEKLEYAKRCQCITKHVGGYARSYEKYTEWFPDHIDVTWVDVTDRAKPSIDRTIPYKNPLGEIPIVCVRYKRSKRFPYMGNSFLRDFAYNNREVMNYTSLLQEFLYRQAFNILAKEVDTSIPLRDQEDGNIGQSNVLEYPKGAEAPTYISPPVAPAEFIASERQRIVVEMFKRAAQDMLNELFNGEKSSGFSQAQSFSKTVPFIASRADTLEKAENAFMAYTMKLMRKTWDGKVKYKDRYELTNIQDSLTQLLQVFRDLYMPSETFVKEELKRLVHELDGKIPDDKLQKILSEIEGMDFKGWQEVQKLALVGNSGQSPGAQQKPKSTGTMAEAAAEAKTGASTKPKPAQQKK
jgi:hypothetical protein